MFPQKNMHTLMWECARRGGRAQSFKGRCVVRVGRAETKGPKKAHTRASRPGNPKGCPNFAHSFEWLILFPMQQIRQYNSGFLNKLAFFGFVLRVCGWGVFPHSLQPKS